MTPGPRKMSRRILRGDTGKESPSTHSALHPISLYGALPLLFSHPLPIPSWSVTNKRELKILTFKKKVPGYTLEYTPQENSYTGS
jgi:hypothetical protein